MLSQCRVVGTVKPVSFLDIKTELPLKAIAICGFSLLFPRLAARLQLFCPSLSEVPPEFQANTVHCIVVTLHSCVESFSNTMSCNSYERGMCLEFVRAAAGVACQA